MLDAAARRSPNARWWMKGDGCDLTEGLKESTHLRWSGDVDLDDGELQREYQHYRETLSFVAFTGNHYHLYHWTKKMFCPPLKGLLLMVSVHFYTRNYLVNITYFV